MSFGSPSPFVHCDSVNQMFLMDSSRMQPGVSVGKAAKAAEDQPKRPLSAYNIFFQVERQRLISNKADDGPYSRAEVYSICLDKETRIEKSKRPHRKIHGMISFTDLAKTIAQKWKALDAPDKVLFEERANDEKRKYAIELEEWLLCQVPTHQVKKRLSALRRGSLSKYIARSATASPPSSVHPISQEQSPASSIGSPGEDMGNSGAPPLGRQHAQMDRARNLERLYRMQIQLYNEQMRLQEEYHNSPAPHYDPPLQFHAQQPPQPPAVPLVFDSTPGQVSRNGDFHWDQNVNNEFVDSHVPLQPDQRHTQGHFHENDAQQQQLLQHGQQRLRPREGDMWLHQAVEPPLSMNYPHAHVEHETEAQPQVAHLERAPLSPLHIEDDFAL